MSESKKEKSEVKSKIEELKSKVRDVFKTRGPLYVDPKYKRPGFVCRWINDKDGNLEDFQNLGYTPIKRKMETGDETASSSHPLGSVVTKNVGGGVTAVLCEIPEELHAFIQAEKEKTNAAYESALKRTGIPTQIGDLSIKDK